MITTAKVTRDAAATTRRIQSTLQKTFGLQALRPGQQPVITRVLQGHNTLAVMPTGAGKSLCYQLPAMLQGGVTLVVSPLIALMKDQCESLRALGIAAVQLNSAVDSEAVDAAEQAIAAGTARIVLTTPERLADPAFRALLARGGKPVSLLVVDEAHCISQWGHDFRPAFLEIAPSIKALGSPTVLALTATATESVTDDIAQQLGIPAAGVLSTGIYRPNLHYRVEQVAREPEKLERTLALVAAAEGSGMVYTATVKAAEAIYDALAAAGESVGRYHGKLSAAERHAAQEAFMDGRVRVMVATNAFGLGIDKSDIRFVVHYQMPAGLDAYYQETGRAGRDGEPADCTLLFLRSDKAVQQFFMAGRYPSAHDVQATYMALLGKPPADARGWTLQALQTALDRPRSKLQVGLSLLRRQSIVRQERDGSIRVLRVELTGEEVETLMAAYQARRTQDREMLEQMVFYAQTGQCRWQVLMDHFAHDDAAEPVMHCHTCDNCRHMAQAAAAQAVAAVQPISYQQQQQQADLTLPGIARTLAAEHGDAAPSPAFAVGDDVKTRRYGAGTVAAVEAQAVTVAFADGSRRSFHPDFVKRAGRVPRRRPHAAAAPAHHAIAA